MKVFLHPDGLIQEHKTSFDGEKATDFGTKLFWDTTGLKSLSHTATKLHKTINPQEACLFYIVVLRHNTAGGVPRGGLVLERQHLYYKIKPEFDTLIPCGQIVF